MSLSSEAYSKQLETFRIRANKAHTDALLEGSSSFRVPVGSIDAAVVAEVAAEWRDWLVTPARNDNDEEVLDFIRSTRRS